MTKKKAVATVACPDGKLQPERSVTKLSKGLGILNEFFITTNATIDIKSENIYKSVSYRSLCRIRNMDKITAKLVRTKGEPMLVMKSIRFVRAGVRMCEMTVSIRVLKGVSSPTPEVAPAVRMIRVRPEKMAIRRKKMFFTVRERFIRL